jgi:hypothetical protein
MAKKSKTSAAKALRGFWKPKGVVNKRHANSFSAWLEKHAEGVDIATFIHSTDYEKKHVEALSALIK